MTITEANAVNTLLNHFLGIETPNGPVAEKAALEAAQILAKKANKTLGAGIHPLEVAANWANPARARAGGS